MKMRISNEVKTGAMVLICIVALTVLLFKVGNWSIMTKGYTVKTQLKFSGGVKKNAPVRLSGVEVGVIKDIRLLDADETSVEIDMYLNGGVQIRKDSIATIAMLGMMGEKYVEIRSGAEKEMVTDGGSIASEEPFRLEDLVKTATKIAEDIGKMARDISKVANDVDRVIVDNRPKLDRIVDNLDETAENFREFSDDVKWHPWKVLAKGSEKPRPEREKERAKRLADRAKELMAKSQASA